MNRQELLDDLRISMKRGEVVTLTFAPSPSAELPVSATAVAG
ncbi:hypothetical protein AB0I37_25955 [Micromonospora purpureochromogenes]